MLPYDAAEIDEAIERIAADVARRSDQPDFHAAEMEALVAGLRQMETARRAGDLVAASAIARGLVPALETYRPTNATSRAKAIVNEVTGNVIGDETQAG